MEHLPGLSDGRERHAMTIRRIGPDSRAEVNAFLREHWFSTWMAVHGELIDLAAADGWTALEDGEIVGLVTFRTVDGELEILSLDSLREGRGTGTALLDTAVREARQAGCTRVTLTTTNDNLHAQEFYRRRGFTVARVRPGAVDEARRLKPEIPAVDDNGIPITDEIDMELIL